jgi:hypothetical protein
MLKRDEGLLLVLIVSKDIAAKTDRSMMNNARKKYNWVHLSLCLCFAPVVVLWLCFCLKLIFDQFPWSVPFNDFSFLATYFGNMSPHEIFFKLCIKIEIKRQDASSCAKEHFRHDQQRRSLLGVFSIFSAPAMLGYPFPSAQTACSDLSAEIFRSSF